MKKICISKNWLFSDNGAEPENIDLPHDFLIKHPRSKNSDGGAANGFFDGKSGKYTKYIEFEDTEHIILDIDGAYMCTRVYLNESIIDMHPNGYMPYLVDISTQAVRNKMNKLQITTENIQPSTRWYSGAGIYRDVFLWTGGALRIEPWDLFVQTKSCENGKGILSVSTDISSDLQCSAQITFTLSDKDNKAVYSVQKNISAKPGKNPLCFDMKVENPILWDVENPYLYTLTAEISVNGTITDTATVPVGIRTISFSSENGFLLNGKSMKLRGGCIHHDHGGLGSAEFPAAVKRKLTLLKKAGFNSLRASHNPPSTAFLDECDRLGILVMDEAFDMWNHPKSGLDYSLWFSDWWDKDISYMVRRDRVHPCVISYSIGNEIPERNGSSNGAVWAKKLSDEIRKHDKSRPVTSGICDMWDINDKTAPDEYKEVYDKCYRQGHEYGLPPEKSLMDEQIAAYTEPLDIIGYNYQYLRYDKDCAKHPNNIYWGSETHALHFYDSWQAVLRHNAVIGDFTWTAYDNLGEAGTGRALWARDGVIKGISCADYPWRTCYQGDLDLCGYRRPQSYFREAVWIGGKEPRIFTTHPEHYNEGFTGTEWHWYDVLDSWTFDDKYIGKPVKTDVYTDADEIHFILNNKVVGKATPIGGIASIDIPYEKGTLTAVSYVGGKEFKRFSLKTVGNAENIVVKAERKSFLADNRDLCYFDICITDKDNNRIPYGNNELECTLTGGELMCIFSGAPANEDQYGSNKCHAFCGRAVAIVRTKKAGSVKLVVNSKGLNSGEDESLAE